MIRILDWDLLQLQYEVLGESVENICKEHDVSTGLLKQAITEKGWKSKKPIATTEFVEDIEQYTTYVSACRQKLTAPLYTKIEYLILQKSIKIVKNIEEDDTKASTKLKALAGTLESLLKHNDILAPDKTDIFETTLKHLDKMHNESDVTLNAKIDELAKQIKAYES